MANEEMRDAFLPPPVQELWQESPFVRKGSLKEIIKDLPSSKNGKLEVLLRRAPTPETGCPSHLLTRRDGQAIDREKYASWSHAYADGASMIVNRADYIDASVRRKCRALAGALGAPHAYANLYATPARAQAVHAHADDRDVFIAQLEGVKRWRVWTKPPIPYPYPHEQVGKDGLEVPPSLLTSDPDLDLDLHPGDVLYIPRGCVHEAHTTKHHSVHLTFALATHDWSFSVLAAAVVRDALDQDVRWRRAPPFFVPKKNGRSLLEDLPTRLHLGDNDDDPCHEPTSRALAEDDMEDLRSAVLEALTPRNLARQLGRRVASQFAQDDDVVKALHNDTDDDEGLALSTRLRRRSPTTPHRVPPDVLRASAHVVKETPHIQTALNDALAAVESATDDDGLPIAKLPRADVIDDLGLICIAAIGLLLGYFEVVVS